MTNGYDLIALCVIAPIIVTGACYVATQPTKPSQRDEREKAILAKLEKFDEWMRQNSAPPLVQEGGRQTEIVQFDTVALLEAIPAQHLLRGQVGTIREVLAQGVLLVEFARAKDGREIATEIIAATKLLKLWHEPSEDINPIGRKA